VALLIDVLPQFAAELARALEEDGYPELAEVGWQRRDRRALLL
jgi:hypothetical protein